MMMSHSDDSSPFPFLSYETSDLGVEKIIDNNNQTTYDILIKCIVVGDTSVGKTSMIKRFVEGRVSDGRSTIGVDWSVKYMTWKDQTIKMEVVS